VFNQNGYCIGQARPGSLQLLKYFDQDYLGVVHDRNGWDSPSLLYLYGMFFDVLVFL
jgi:hypothetical protein